MWLFQFHSAPKRPALRGSASMRSLVPFATTASSTVADFWAAFPPVVVPGPRGVPRREYPSVRCLEIISSPVDLDGEGMHGLRNSLGVVRSHPVLGDSETPKRRFALRKPMTTTESLHSGPRRLKKHVRARNLVRPYGTPTSLANCDNMGDASTGQLRKERPGTGGQGRTSENDTTRSNCLREEVSCKSQPIAHGARYNIELSRATPEGHDGRTGSAAIRAGAPTRKGFEYADSTTV